MPTKKAARQCWSTTGPGTSTTPSLSQEFRGAAIFALARKYVHSSAKVSRDRRYARIAFVAVIAFAVLYLASHVALALLGGPALCAIGAALGAFCVAVRLIGEVGR